MSQETLTSEDILQMIEDCEKRESKLTTWEQEFIQSLSEQYNKKDFTKYQLNKLEQIWDRVT
jgi:hypothetical protein